MPDLTIPDGADVAEHDDAIHTAVNDQLRTAMRNHDSDGIFSGLKASVTAIFKTGEAYAIAPAQILSAIREHFETPEPPAADVAAALEKEQAAVPPPPPPPPPPPGGQE